MLISRKLAHKAQSRLQVIMSLVEMERKQQAVTAIHELADFLNAYVESKDDEKARGKREEHED